MTKGGWVAVPPTTVWIKSCMHEPTGESSWPVFMHAWHTLFAVLESTKFLARATYLSSIADWYVCHLRWMPVCNALLTRILNQFD